MAKSLFRLLTFTLIFNLVLSPSYAATDSKYPFPKNWVKFITEITQAKFPRQDNSVEDENLKGLVDLIKNKYYERITGELDIRDIVKNRKKAFDLILKSIERYKDNRYREAVLFLAYQLGATLPDLSDYTRLNRIKSKLMDDAAVIIRRDFYKVGITLFSLMSTLELCEYMETTQSRPIWYNGRSWRSKNHLRLSSQTYFNLVLNYQRSTGDTAATEEAIRITSLRNDFNNLVGVYYFAWKFSHGSQQLNYAKKIKEITTETARDFQFNNYAEGYVKNIDRWLSRKLRAEIRTIEVTGFSEIILTDWGKFRFNLANNPAIKVDMAPQLQVAWQKNLMSPIFSSPSIIDGLIYVGTDDGQVLVLDANTGRQIWAYRLGMGIDSTPLINEGVLYVGNNDGFVYALDLADQIIRWKTAIGDSCISSPAFYNDRIYLGSYSYKSRIYCLDANTGEILWSVKSMNAVYSSPAIAKGVVYIGSCGGVLYALDALTGEEVWKYNMARSIYASPCLAEDKVFIGSWSGDFVALDAKTGSLLWSFSTGSKIDVSAVFYDGLVSFATDTGMIYTLDSKNGTVAWQADVKQRIFSSPVILGDKIYYLPWDDKLHVIDLITGKELFKFNVGSRVNSSIAYYGRLLYFGTDSGEFYALEEK